MPSKTILCVRALHYKPAECRCYPIRLACDREFFAPDRSALLREWGVLDACALPDACRRYGCWVQERVESPSTDAPEVVEEALYIDGIPAEQYRCYADFADRPFAQQICGWRFKQGDLVEVFRENEVTLGVILAAPAMPAKWYYHHRQLQVADLLGERPASDWPIEDNYCPMPISNVYRVLLFDTAENLAERAVPATRLRPATTLSAPEQKAALQAQYEANIHAE